jgi:hypothetical protein
MNERGPFCNCSAVAFCGGDCGKAKTECDTEEADRGKRQQDTAKVGEAKEALEREKDKCK